MKNFFVTTWNFVKYALIHQLVSIACTIFATVIYLGYLIYEEIFKETSFDFDVRVENQLYVSLSFGLIAGGILSFILFKWMLKRKRRNIYEVCRFKKLSTNTILVTLAAGLSFAFTDFLLTPLLYYIKPESLDNYQETMSSLEQGGTLLLIVMVVIVAPLIEEIVFRGLVFDELERKTSISLTILIQGLLFGLIHMNLLQGVSAAISGVYYALLLIWTGSIWAPILAHGVTNLLAIITTTEFFQGFTDQYAILSWALIFIVILVVLPLSTIYLYKNRVDFEVRRGDIHV